MPQSLLDFSLRQYTLDDRVWAKIASKLHARSVKIRSGIVAYTAVCVYRVLVASIRTSLTLTMSSMYIIYSCHPNSITVCCCTQEPQTGGTPATTAPSSAVDSPGAQRRVS